MTAETEPYARAGLLGRAAPYAGITLLAFAVLPLPPNPAALDVIAAQVVIAVTFAAVVFVPWRRLPSWTQVLPSIAYLAAVGLLRQAEGGAISAVSPLVMVPVFWLALYGTPRQLGVTIAAVAALFLVPVLLDPPSYPGTEWERAILWTATACVIGYTGQGLVGRIRRQAALLDGLARTDEATGLPNRRAWHESLASRIAEAGAEGPEMSIVALELDGFEAFMERHGRQEAEKLLKVAGSAWARTLRAKDVLARSGPREFRLLLVGADIEEAVERVEGLRPGTPAMQTFSAGIARWDGRESIEALIARADAALDRARRLGEAVAVAPEPAQGGAEEILRRALARLDPQAG